MARGLALVSGTLWGAWIGAPALLVGALATVGLLALAARSPPRGRRWCVGAVFVVLGTGWGALVAPNEPPVASPDGQVRLHGTAHEILCRQVDRCTVWLGDVTADGVPIRGMVPLRTDGDARDLATPGARIGAWAHLEARRIDSNPGVHPPWSEPRHRWRAKARLDHGVEVVAEAPDLRTRARVRLRRVLTLPGEEATAFYRAILLGDRSGVDPALREAFVDSGTAHLLAISGLHLGVIGWGLYRLILWGLLRVPRLAQVRRLPALAAGTAAGMCWLYVLAIIPSHATIRATLVLTVVFGAATLARRSRPGRALLLAGMLLLLVDPRAVGTASFQLSFAAASALVVGLPPMHRGLRWLEEPGRLPDPRWQRPTRIFLTLLGVSALTFAATAPLTIAWFGQLAPIGLLTNLVAVPLVSLVVVPVGFAWLGLAQIAPFLAEVTASVPVAACGVLLDLVEAWADWAGASTRAAWPHAAGLVGAVAVVTAVSMRRTAAWVALAAAGIAGALVVGGQPPRDGLVMTSLDVGHGDAVVLQLPGGPTALVDTGGHFFPQAEDALVRRRLVPALTRLGIDRLDLVVVTHADRDHVGAGAALARRIPVGELWLPPCELASPGVKAFAEAVARSGGTVRRIHRAAPVRWQGVDMELLWPPPDVVERDGSCRGGKNEASVVLALRYAGRRVLLAGDVEDDSEARLVREVADGLRADVLKVPHHGSRSSSTVEFLERVRPRVAVVTGQWKAGPMPPHPAVVRRYRRLGSHTWITGRDGAVTVRVDPDGSLSADGVRGPSWRSSPGEEVLRPP